MTIIKFLLRELIYGLIFGFLVLSIMLGVIESSRIILGAFQ